MPTALLREGASSKREEGTTTPSLFDGENARKAGQPRRALGVEPARVAGHPQRTSNKCSGGTGARLRAGRNARGCGVGDHAPVSNRFLVNFVALRLCFSWPAMFWRCSTSTTRFLPNGDSDEQAGRGLPAFARQARPRHVQHRTQGLGRAIGGARPGESEYAVEFYLSTLKPFTARRVKLHPTFMRERILPSIPAAARSHRQASQAGPFQCPDHGDQPLRSPIARELGFENHIAAEPEMKQQGRYTGRILGTTCTRRQGRAIAGSGWPNATYALRLPRELVLQPCDSQNDLPAAAFV